ncbi:MAG TPA: hypothetical protein P5567_07575 [Kiritimatiellia bacterium]|nr:hypothetical protein [Kiritimatiellia bacterium]HRZ12299.1 hypothetical protein [Kiritimatiellia bacterium]HSA17943.1 hypothetical protein [Kiritimatiellia bacterium]
MNLPTPFFYRIVEREPARVAIVRDILGDWLGGLNRTEGSNSFLLAQLEGKGMNYPWDRRICMPYSGSIVAMTVTLSAGAATNGSATISAAVNGVLNTNLFATINNTWPTNGAYTAIPPGTLTFSAGDCLGIIGSSTDFDVVPTDRKMIVRLYVTYNP